MSEEIPKGTYEAYVSAAGGKSLVSGQPLPTWDALPDPIKAAWRNAAAWAAGAALRRMATRPTTCLARKNEVLHAKLEGQMRGYDYSDAPLPKRLYLTHDEIDAWRCQFDDPVPPVEMLAYRGVPIVCSDCENMRQPHSQTPSAVETLRQMRTEDLAIEERKIAEMPPVNPRDIIRRIGELMPKAAVTTSPDTAENSEVMQPHELAPHEKAMNELRHFAAKQFLMPKDSVLIHDCLETIQEWNATLKGRIEKTVACLRAHQEWFPHNEQGQEDFVHALMGSYIATLTGEPEPEIPREEEPKDKQG